MKSYTNILLALELEPKSDKAVLSKAKELVQQFHATLWIIHSVEHLSSYGAAYGVAAGIDVDEILKKEAEQLMKKIAKSVDIPETQTFVKEGPAKQNILHKAQEIKAELIIVGSHGRHGVQLLLGSTANAIIHGAECDVLAVRVHS